jgi:hypothetical protein
LTLLLVPRLVWLAINFQLAIEFRVAINAGFLVCQRFAVDLLSTGHRVNRVLRRLLPGSARMRTGILPVAVVTGIRIARVTVTAVTIIGVGVA